MMMASVCKRPEIHKEAAIGSRIDSMQIVPANISRHQPSQNDANLIQCSLQVHYLFIMMISRYLKDRLKDLRTKRREH